MTTTERPHAAASTIELRPGRAETDRLAGRVAVPAADREPMTVTSPLNGAVVGEVPVGTDQDVVDAVAARPHGPAGVGRHARAGPGGGAAALPRPGARPAGRAARPDPGRERQGPRLGVRGDHGPGGHRPVLRPARPAGAQAPAPAQRAAGARVHQGALRAQGRRRGHLAVELPAGAGGVRRASPPWWPATPSSSSPTRRPRSPPSGRSSCSRRPGLPAGLVQIVTGPGRVVGTAIIDHADYVMFTGSTATGRTVARQAGERLIGVSAELGRQERRWS